MSILILTENVFNEQPFYNNLQRLNYEVFTSFELLKYWQKNKELSYLLDLFSIVIISETISLALANQIVKSLKKPELVFIRKLDQIPTETEAVELEAQGFNAWLSSNASLDDIRETLFAYREKTRISITSTEESNHTNIKILSLISVSLTPTEQRILGILMKNGTQPVRREELVREIWHTMPTNSNLSQLSYRISHLKKVVSEMFGINEAIVTSWGLGYQLSQECYRLLSDYAPSLD